MNLNDLNKLGSVSIELALGSQNVVQLQHLVRVLPQRRLVFRATWQARDVYVKLFLGKQAARYAMRDAQGSTWMLAAGLRTPKMLWQGFVQDSDVKVHVLIYAAVQSAVNASDACATAVQSERLKILKSIVRILAAQHAAGLCQTDLHLNNFLFENQLVWAIDGDGIRQQVLSVKQAHRQLAELISKIHVLDQCMMTKHLLDTYLKARSWTASIPASKVLSWAMQMKTREVERYVHDKIFRSCSDVRWQQAVGEAQAVSVAGGLQSVSIDAIETAMQQGQALKQGNTCTVSKATLQGRTVVIKRYNIKNTWHALSRAWRPSRAAASWMNAHRLQYYGFSTPQPLLMLESRTLGLRGKAYFVAEYSPWPDALTFFKQTRDKRLRAEALKQVALFCYQLYLLKLSHGDMKASNLQIADQGQVVVMDLDSMRQHTLASAALRAHVKDLLRLLQNWKDDTSLYNALLKSLRVVYADPTPLQQAGISV